MHVLIVEDEIELATLLSEYLVQANFSVTMVHDGALVHATINDIKPDLLVLDVMLPNKDGITLCREIRQTNQQLPIIMATAKVEEVDRLLGLELGADDYICKPYSPREVVARVKAVLRRQLAVDDPAQAVQLVLLDDERMLAKINNETLDLTLFEYQLLSVLSRAPAKIYSRQQLMDNIYSDNRIVSDRTIDSHIKKLRKKLNAVFEGELIHSVYGVGYKFEQIEKYEVVK